MCVCVCVRESDADKEEHARSGHKLAQLFSMQLI